MASKIDKINVNGTSYDIDLPSTATPSITGLTVTTLTVGGDTTITGELSTEASVTISKDLTVTGNLTVSGTSTLASVNCTALTCSGQVAARSVTTQTLTTAIANISSTLLVRDGIVGTDSSRAVRFLTDIGSPYGALYLTPLSTTPSNQT